MRYAILLVIVAGCRGAGTCASCPVEPDAAPPTCPQSPPDDGSCDLPDGNACFFQNGRSSCMSETCTCHAGFFQCVDVASEGASCANAAVSSCGVGGVPDCDPLITGLNCACGADGRWDCVCSCYSASNGCGDCPATYSPLLEGVACDAIDNVCSFPGGHSCTCTADATGSHFHCS